MARIGIPAPVFPGIKFISQLAEAQITSLVNYLKNLPIESEFDVVAKELNSLLDIKKSTNLLQTILSFSELVKQDNEGNENIAISLTESYIELSGDMLSKKDQQILKNNLYNILSNYEGITELLNFRKSFFENENNVVDLNIITDLRLVFKDNIEDKNRLAIIYHKLHLEYRDSEISKKVYFTLDVEDLNKLKAEIDKAILKDQVLREDYKEILKFVI